VPKTFSSAAAALGTWDTADRTKRRAARTMAIERLDFMIYISLA
jgi:hypothetical protein